MCASVRARVCAVDMDDLSPAAIKPCGKWMDGGAGLLLGNTF